MNLVLSEAAVTSIHKAIDTVFDRVGGRLLLDKEILVEARPGLSLPGIFEAASASEYTSPDRDRLRVLTEGVRGYLDSYRARTKTEVVKAVTQALAEGGDLKQTLDRLLAGIWKKATSDLERMVATETHVARNVGVLDGLVKVNAAQGIEDPVVFFVVVRDGKRCGECTRLHLLEDGITPRLWYLSEVGHGYHKKGEENPKLAGLHPNCRCALSTLLKGFGYDRRGLVTFKGLHHDEMARQRGSVEKHEVYDSGGCTCTHEPLQKFMPEGEDLLHAVVAPHVQKRSQLPLDWEQRQDLRFGAERKRFLDTAHPSGLTIPDPHSLHPGVKSAIVNAPVTINFPVSALAGLAGSGRVLNLGAEGAGEGLGETDHDIRRDYEEKVFGVPTTEPWQKRPLYGALNFHPDLLRHYGAAPSYGEMYMTLKPHVQARTTYTPEDSFSCDGDSHSLGDVLVPHLDRDREALAERYLHVDPKDAARLHHFFVGTQGQDIPRRSTGYIEAQVWGGVDLGQDVDSIHIGPEAYDRGRYGKVDNPLAGPEVAEQAAVALGKKHEVKVISHRPLSAYAGRSSPITETVLYDPGTGTQKKPRIGAKPRKPRLPRVPKIRAGSRVSPASGSIVERNLGEGAVGIVDKISGGDHIVHWQGPDGITVDVHPASDLRLAG